MYKFGLIKDKGTWNTPTTNIYYNNYFDGYKPVQSTECFGLINSTDGNFWLLSEDDDHYRTTCKISEETIRTIFNELKIKLLLFTPLKYPNISCEYENLFGKELGL